MDRSVGGPWVIGMRWERLLFAHWPIPAEELRGQIPDGLALDTFDGRAWLGIVPFRMARVGPAGLPLPGRLGNFGEVNVRTYVRPINPADGPPGVWFLSLDAENPYVVAGGRTIFHLPYLRARISIVEDGAVVEYRSRRTHGGAPNGRFEARYRPTDAAELTTPGSLEEWLTARSAVYSADRHDTLFRGDIRHDRWRLAPAEWELGVETLLAGLGLRRPDGSPLLHQADPLDVIAAWPVRLGRDLGESEPTRSA
jgi:uncharacterized protein YqjF (DUF2071 family)